MCRIIALAHPYWFNDLSFFCGNLSIQCLSNNALPIQGWFSIVVHCLEVIPWVWHYRNVSRTLECVDESLNMKSEQRNTKEMQPQSFPFSSFLLFTYFVYPSFPSSLCVSLAASLSFITLRQLGQKSQAFGSVGDSAIQHPVCHNTGTTECGYCQLMAVYPL